MAEINPNIGPQIGKTLEAFKDQQAEAKEEAAIAKDNIRESLAAGHQEKVNPFGHKLKTRQKKLKDNFNRIRKAQSSVGKKKQIIPLAKVRDSAEKFQRRNPELKAKILVMLKGMIKSGDKAKDILKKTRQVYKDVALADEAMEFLEEVSGEDMRAEVAAAKEQLNEEFGREIQGGRNIGEQVRKFAEKGLGAPTALRDLYADITGNPREPKALFQELSERFTYKDLRKVIAFMLHSLGSDLKSQGPSIPRGLLHRLVSETRSLQAILGVYVFFKGRMKIVNKEFGKNGISVPDKLNFERLAKEFMNFVGERYPSSDKVLRMAKKLGIEEWLMAKIIVFAQLRDAIRQVAGQQFYKNIQHRDDCYLALIEALEDLEDELEELEEKEEQEQEAEDEAEYDEEEV